MVTHRASSLSQSRISTTTVDRMRRSARVLAIRFDFWAPRPVHARRHAVATGQLNETMYRLVAYPLVRPNHDPWNGNEHG